MSDDDLSWNVWFFFLAQLLHGAGAAPLFTLGVTFIDENVSKKMSSVYLGKYRTQIKKIYAEQTLYHLHATPFQFINARAHSTQIDYICIYLFTYGKP